MSSVACPRGASKPRRFGAFVGSDQRVERGLRKAVYLDGPRHGTPMGCFDQAASPGVSSFGAMPVASAFKRRSYHCTPRVAGNRIAK
jgi:hypothetical protein